MIIYCEKCHQRFDTDLHEECPRCDDRPKFEPPAMPSRSSFFYPTSLYLDTAAYEEAIESWGRECANLAQREAALADELAGGLNRFLESSACSNGCDPNDMTCDTNFARAIVARYKEARNG